jgi:hypothetical protein
VIISASRRTDIPAYYAQWFYNRLREGYVLVRNPYRPHQCSKVIITPDVVDCIVFWTKDPRRMLPYLESIEAKGYPFYFQFTLTPYGSDVEAHLPEKDVLIEAFCSLSRQLGAQRVVWRYDPILSSPGFSVHYHYTAFERLAEKLAGYTKQCVFSFADQYPNMSKEGKNITRALCDQEKLELAGFLAALARRYGMRLSACCEGLDYSDLGVTRASCIDQGLIEQLIGVPLLAGKAAGQRKECGCIQSVDIGEYQSCIHGCKYCYAVQNEERAMRNFRQHHPDSPLLVGWPQEYDQIIERKGASLQQLQLTL